MVWKILRKSSRQKRYAKNYFKMKWIKSYGEILLEQSNDQKITSDVYFAIVRDDADELKKLLVDDATNRSIYFRDGDFILVNTAIFLKSYNCLRALLEIGADPNEVNSSGVTPLFYVVNSNNIEATKILLDGGADPNILNPDVDAMNTPQLQEAIRDGYFEMIKVLLEGGADPNLSPMIIHLAIDKISQDGDDDELEVLKTLIEYNVDVNNAINKYHNTTPLEETINRAKRRFGKDKVYEALIKASKMLINAGANPIKAFESYEDMEELLGKSSLWYSGDIADLKRKFTASKIRKGLF